MISMKWMTQPVLILLRYHKFKIFIMVMSAIFFFVWFFPLSDLSLYVSSTIAKNTNNQVILQFDDLSLNVLPSLGFKLSPVVMDTPFISGLEMQNMILMPSFLPLLTGNMGIAAHLNETLGGYIHLFVKTLGFNDQGVPKIQTELQTQNIQIGQLLDNTVFQLDMNGVFHVQGQGQWDLSFETQPDFKLRTQAQNFQLQSVSVPTQIGPFMLPSINLKTILIQMNLKEGQMQVEALELGQRGDDLVAQINGYLNVQFRQGANGPRVLPGSYDLSCRLTLQPFLENQFRVFMNVLNLSRYKKEGTYAFRITGSPNQVPNIRGL